MTEQTNLSVAQTEILVVEDSPLEAELLRRCLNRAGYRVTLAKNGEEGLQAARARRPALVVSDINMPLMNGYELCREIKHDEVLWNIPVILLTSLSEPENIIYAINVGTDSYITKPFVEASLLERVHSLLSTPIRRKRLEERRMEKVEYNSKPYAVTGGGQQILSLMLSVYGNSLAQNQELTHIQTQINLLNDNLNEQVRERTAELLLEKQKLERANRELRTLSACNVALVHATTEEELIQNVCRHIVEIRGHLFAEVSFPSQGSESKPESIPCPVLHFGSDTISQRLAELALDSDPAYVRIRHNETLAAQSARQTKGYNSARNSAEYSLEKLAGLGIESWLSLPLINNDQLDGMLTVFSSTTETFDAAEINLMEELAGDIAYGIVTLRTRAERDRALEGELRSAAELRRVLEQTITAVALTLGKRDPYDAERQQRVDKLAAAIATEMGLSPQQLESLKLHTQTGFEIVKDISFPWLVAQMVLQHHERLGGAAYPQGLKGEQIMVEARILAVADVLEAMMTFRPYRAALGMDAACDTLTQGRGTQFDPAVVDACLRVVNKPGYGTRG